ncbi:MAG: LysE family transporter [Bacteroidales bacterium]|nr:LysE family transporter [Bacteroidales bacterium]
MLLEIMKALLVGFIAALPIGPIFVMVAQGTLCHDRRAGLMIGLGAATGDLVYAGLGLLTLELVTTLILAHQGLFMLAGGVLIAAIGIWMFYREVSLELPAAERQVSDWTCALQGFTSALSNPAALAAMLALLAAFHLGSESSRVPLWALVLSVGAGEAMYWFFISGLMKRYLRISGRSLRFGSKLAGSLVFLFAMVLLVRGGLMIISN